MEGMRHNHMPMIRKKPSHLIIHAGRNDAKRNAKFKKNVGEQVPDCKVIISTPTVKADDEKAGITVSQLTNQLHELKTDIADNTDITSRHIGIKGVHLNFLGMTQLAKNFANVIKKI